MKRSELKQLIREVIEEVEKENLEMQNIKADFIKKALKANPKVARELEVGLEKIQTNEYGSPAGGGTEWEALSLEQKLMRIPFNILKAVFIGTVTVPAVLAWMAHIGVQHMIKKYR